MRFESKLNVVRCVEQLRMGMVQSLHWVSDGSMHKVVYGRLMSVDVCSGGLRLTLDNGRSVRWRMDTYSADRIIGMVYSPVAVPMIPLFNMINAAEFFAVENSTVFCDTSYDLSHYNVDNAEWYLGCFSSVAFV